MKSRYLVLVALLAWRLVVGGYVTHSCLNGQKISLSGKVNNIILTDTNKIAHVGTFYFQLPLKTGLASGAGVTVIGTCQRRVSDFFLSRTELVSGQIVEIQPPVIQVFDPRSLLDNLRNRLANVYQRQLPEPEASLVAGVVLGAKSALPEDFYRRLIDTGTVQIVVASGYNLSLVAIFLGSFLWWFFSKRTAAFVLLSLALLYALLTGGDPPVMRAFLMLSIVTLAPLFGRQLPTGYVFWLALWLILFLDPQMVESISFQLSAAATGGLIYFQKPVMAVLDRLKLKRLLGALGDDLASTFAAQLTTAPIIMFHFSRISLWAPITNTLIAPLIAPLTILGFLSQLEATVLPHGGIVSLSTYILARSVTLVIKLFS